MRIEIEKFAPCIEALKFRKNYKSFEEAWNDCPRGDWMLWISAKINVDEKLLFKAKALCAKTVIHLMKDDRSKKAVQAALDYSEGKITKEELKRAANAANAAYAASDAAYAAANAAASAYAASAYAYAYAASAYAASAAAYAASDAAYAASDAASAAANASAANASAAAKNNRQETADICREVLTTEVFKKIKTI